MKTIYLNTHCRIQCSGDSNKASHWEKCAHLSDILSLQKMIMDSNITSSMLLYKFDQNFFFRHWKSYFIVWYFYCFILFWNLLKTLDAKPWQEQKWSYGLCRLTVNTPPPSLWNPKHAYGVWHCLLLELENCQNYRIWKLRKLGTHWV